MHMGGTSLRFLGLPGRKIVSWEYPWGPVEMLSEDHEYGNRAGENLSLAWSLGCLGIRFVGPIYHT